MHSEIRFKALSQFLILAEKAPAYLEEATVCKLDN